MNDQQESNINGGNRGSIMGLIKSIPCRVQFLITHSFLEYIDLLLLLLLFLSLSSPFPLEIGSTLFWGGEPIALLFIVWWLITKRRTQAHFSVSQRRMIWIFCGIAIWALFIWCISKNWNDQNIILRTWIYSAAIFYILQRDYLKNNVDGKKVSTLFVVSAIPNVIMGLYQYLFKLDISHKSLWGGASTTSILVRGFFGHSNDFALYLYWPFIISMGLIFISKKWPRTFFIAFSVISFFELFISYSRTTIVTLGFALLILTVWKIFPQKKWFTLSLAGLSTLAVAGLYGFYVIFLPQYRSLSMIDTGRIAHWINLIKLILKGPALLPLGYLQIPYPLQDQPHNIYLFAWIHYGWPGAILVLCAAVYFLRIWWMKYALFRERFSMAVLWTGLAGFLLVNGMAILYFHESFAILPFVCVMALWVQYYSNNYDISPGDDT